MGSVGSCIKSYLVSEFLEYETPKIVTIKSRFIGILNKLVQITIVVYIVVWVFILNHGYQYIDVAAVSGMTSKLKGIAYTNSTDPRIGERVWDTTDLIKPPQQNEAFFVTTNIISTHNQSQGVCPELKWNKAECENDSDCLPAGKPYHLGNGVSTGKCNTETKTCLVRAWCPLENDTLTSKHHAALAMSKDFTVFIKSHVYFPYFKRKRSNLIEFIDKKYLRSCNYHPVNEPYCPIFRLSDIVSLAEDKSNPPVVSDTYFEQMAVKGGVISISIIWDCNFDHDETLCRPTYKFDRLDSYEGNTIASGFNFRYPINYYEDGILKRQLVKAYGILFMVKTEAQARAFDIITFLRNLGSGLALLGIASVCCDIFLLYVHRKKSYFKDHIFHQVDKDDISNEKHQLNLDQNLLPTKEGENGHHNALKISESETINIAEPEQSIV